MIRLVFNSEVVNDFFDWWERFWSTLFLSLSLKSRTSQSQTLWFLQVLDDILRQVEVDQVWLHSFKNARIMEHTANLTELDPEVSDVEALVEYAQDWAIDDAFISLAK